MSEETTVSVNFSRPIPLLPQGTARLLPHGVLPVEVTEDRYRQLVSDALDGQGQIGMAVVDGDWPRSDPPDTAPFRPAVCVGQIIDHHRFPDGRYAVAMQGICRAVIKEEIPSEDGRPYRQAMLEPVGLETADEEVLTAVRHQLGDMLSTAPMTDLRDAAAFAHHLRDEQVPTTALLDLLSFVLLTEPGLRYRLLEQADARRRAALVLTELESVRLLLTRAGPQRLAELPKGCCWN
ncbi:MAG: LON peptidase substrate-binding domain-containing protein [Phycisphaeraceae bacterium]|nr:LON peptidase substrate-binding domain-containing protein [Phycisphaeraceae bacterium]